MFKVLLLLVGPAWPLMVFPEGKEAETANPSWSGHHEVFSDVLVGKQQQQQQISEETLPGHDVISDVLRSVIHPVHGVIHDDRKLTFEHALAGINRTSDSKIKCKSISWSPDSEYIRAPIL